ncbi:hypothetical protein [Marinomonas gallaica]|uniref:hypothetical protein n=1 Tax=Marinomonas gallaica TaxID=1806667 RepID=UPI003A940133
MSLDRFKRLVQKNITVLIVLSLIIFLFFLNLFWIEGQTLNKVLESIVITGLPSLLSIVSVSIAIEYSVRRKERRELKKFIRQESGFIKHIVKYENIAKEIFNFLSIDDDDSIESIQILMIGSDTAMVKSIINSIGEIYRSKCSLEILLLDPESELSVLRGNSLGRHDYQSHIRSNLSSLVKWLENEVKHSNSLIRTARIKLYRNQIPPAMTIRIGNEFVVFSPVWANENVKSGPFCFVPKDNGMFKILCKSFDDIPVDEHYKFDGR